MMGRLDAGSGNGRLLLHEGQWNHWKSLTGAASNSICFSYFPCCVQRLDKKSLKEKGLLGLTIRGNSPRGREATAAVAGGGWSFAAGECSFL